MAKKTVVAQAKKALAKKKEVKPAVEVATEDDIQNLHQVCLTITARIDRIVAALSTAKPIKKDM